MAAPNYAAYDGPNDDDLSLSEAAHLWVEMVPPPERDGQPFPGLPGTGWKRDFWRWLKRHIRRRLKLRYVPKGRHQFTRSLYLEIATSEEYAALLKTIPQLKARPLILFPEERPNRGPAKANAEPNCRDWLTKKMEGGKEAKEKSKDLYLAEARKLFNCSKPQFERAWADANLETGSGWDQGGAPRKK